MKKLRKPTSLVWAEKSLSGAQGMAGLGAMVTPLVQ